QPLRERRGECDRVRDRVRRSRLFRIRQRVDVGEDSAEFQRARAKVAAMGSVGWRAVFASTLYDRRFRWRVCRYLPTTEVVSSPACALLLTGEMCKVAR